MTTLSIQRAAVLATAATLVCVGCERPERTSTAREAEPAEEGASEGGSPGAASGSIRDEEGSVTDQLERPGDFEVIAHRGARALKPENTLPSVDVALDARPDIIEIDLHLSEHGNLVVWHDPFVRASKCRRPESLSPGINERGNARGWMLPAPAEGDQTPDYAKVRNLSTTDLRSYVCDRNPDPDAFPEQNAGRAEVAKPGYGIVTLSEFLEFVETYAASDRKTEAQRRNAREVEFFLEIKRHPDHPSYIDDGFDADGPAKMEKELVSVVREFGVVDRTVVQGFTKPSLWAVRKLEPDLRLSVAEAERDRPLAEYADRGATYWSPNWELVDEESVREAHEAGLRVVPWTVNGRDEIRRLMELGVDGIITDDPTLFATPGAD